MNDFEPSMVIEPSVFDSGKFYFNFLLDVPAYQIWLNSTQDMPIYSLKRDTLE